MQAGSGAGAPGVDAACDRDSDGADGMDLSRYTTVAATPPAAAWLRLHAHLGLAPGTVTAYGRALEDFLRFCGVGGTPLESASRTDLAAYVRELTTRPNARAGRGRSGATLANATVQQRLTAVRLFYDYLVEEGIRPDNPVGRGRHTPGRGFAGAHAAGFGHSERGLVPRYQTLPWLPSDDEWCAVLEATRAEPLRNRLMLALAYDAGLRREELCRLETGDVDPSARLLRIRAETTKGRRERVVPYSVATGELYAAYLPERRVVGHARRPRGPLFLSASRRNRGRPITRWTWSKVVVGIARRAGVPRFSTHTPRHLCLTDLARAGWELHEIAQFAGHRDEQSTLRYIHLSGRDLAAKLERGMAALHAWRVQMMAQVLQ